MKKSSDKQVRFGVRLSAGEVIQLEAIARHLGITKSEVLRLSLSAQSGLKDQKPGTDSAAMSKALDAVSLKVQAVDDRLHNLESLLGSAVDLLLSVSRNTQPPEFRRNEQTPPASQIHATPKWSDYIKKNFKTSPVMSDQAWSDFLKKRYEETYGHPPDLST